MRRLARPLFFVGIAAAVLGLGKAHAVANGYDLTSSFRFSWSLAYIVLIAVCAYGIGLPELGGTRRGVILATVGSTVAAAGGMSLLQLLAGSALLPRFVVFVTPASVVPWALLSADLARDGGPGPDGATSSWWWPAWQRRPNWPTSLGVTPSTRQSLRASSSRGKRCSGGPALGP